MVLVKLTVPSVTAVVPVFFTVTNCAALVAPTAVEAKVSVVGDIPTVKVAAVAVPDQTHHPGEFRSRYQQSRAKP